MARSAASLRGSEWRSEALRPVFRSVATQRPGLDAPPGRWRSRARIADLYQRPRRRDCDRRQCWIWHSALAAAGLQSTEPQVAAPAWAVVDWVKGLVGLAVIGLLFTLLLPRFSERTAELEGTAFWSSLGIGFGLFIGVPVVAIVVFILGTMLGGWMLGFALLALYAMACAVGYTFAAIFTGKMVLQLLHQPVQHLAWNLLEGLAVLGLIGLVPVLGGLVILLACILGLGAFALNIVFTYRSSRPLLGVVASAPTPPQPQLAAA